MRSRRGVRVLCVAGFVTAAAIAVLFFVTRWWGIGFGTQVFVVHVWDGGIEMRLGTANPPGLGWHSHLRLGEKAIWTPRFADPYFFIPLWIPFVAILVPSLIGWYRSRRPQPGHCRKCSYDLTGNASGVCPECGTRIERS